MSDKKGLSLRALTAGLAATGTLPVEPRDLYQGWGVDVKRPSNPPKAVANKKNHRRKKNKLARKSRRKNRK